MTQVSGSLKLVTGSPAEVSQVWLRAPNGRVQGAEYVTEAPDTIQVTGGAVSFDALPGAMVMTLVSHGAPMHTVKLLVPDKTSATLAECIEAAELASDGTRSALERLALEVQAELGQVPSLVASALAQDSTIIDAVQQASALRVDTTVGTRVFMGDTMIHGDTGWREIVPINGWVGAIYVRRVNNTVYYRGRISAETASNSNAWDMPTGFRAGNMVSSNGHGYEYGRALVYTDGTEPKFRNVSFYFSRFSITSYDSAHTYGISLSYPTTDPWPTTLPGTPA